VSCTSRANISHLPDASKLAQLFGAVGIGREYFHSRAQGRICEIGRDLGFKTIQEFEVQSLVEFGRRSFIDVVWVSDAGLIAAFEIKPKKTYLETITTHKDVAKLQNLDAYEKFIVNASELTGKAYFHKVSATTIPRPKTYSIVRTRTRYPRAYETWTEAEDQQLIDEYRKRVPVLSLAAWHQRQPSAIQSRLVRLGLIRPRGLD